MLRSCLAQDSSAPVESQAGGSRLAVRAVAARGHFFFGAWGFQNPAAELISHFTIMFQAISGIFPLVPLVFLPKISCGLGPVRLDFSAMPFLSLASKKASRSMPQSQKVCGVTVEIQSILRMDDILMLQGLRSFIGATMFQGTIRIAPKGFGCFLCS